MDISKENIIENIDPVTQLNDLTNQLEHIEESLKQISENESPNSPDEIKNNIFENAVAYTMIDLVNSEVNPKSELELVLDFIKNNDKIKELLNKLNVSIDSNSETKLNNIIEFLSKNNAKFDDFPPIKNIIDEIKNIFADGKIDLCDVPSLINVVTNILNFNLNQIKIKIDTNIVSILIKLLIHILIIEKIIKINEIEEKIIDKMIDTSLVLLNTTINIANVKCSCFSFLNKKN